MAKNENTRTSGQRRFDCQIPGCEEKGRKLASLMSIPIAYCPVHRKMGERVLNFLVDSVFRYQLTDFLKDVKHELFMKHSPSLCDPCYETIGSYIQTKVIQLDKLKTSYEKVQFFEEPAGSPA